MPELPEVEVVRRGLDRWVSGREVSEVQVLHPRAIRRQSGPFEQAVVGRRIRCVSRRGKYLWMPLDPARAVGGAGAGDATGQRGNDQSAMALVAHLGMSGQLLVQEAGAPDEAHLRVRFEFADGGRELRFVDQRTFGGVMTAALVPDAAGGFVPDLIEHIARDPLDPDFDDEEFSRRLRSRSTEVKRALLDQSLVSGIGNIYADEALWRCEVHGRRLTNSLGEHDVRSLLGHARGVMIDALAQGGTSFDALYVNVNGESGYFDRSLNAYGQEGEPCDRCGTAIEREKFMNRSSFTCPRCQRPA